MAGRVLRFVVLSLAGCTALLPNRVLAQGEGSGLPVSTPLSGGLTRSITITDLDLYIKGPDGKPIEGTALVTLTKLDGQFYKQGTAKDGYVRFNELAQSEYNVQVLAPGFARVTKQIEAYPEGTTLMKVTIRVEPAAEGIDATTDMEVQALAPKAQKALGKAIEALRANKPGNARSSLETAVRIAPKSAEVQYAYGVYEMGVGDKAQAKTYWTKSLELHPQHFRALISLSQELLGENKPSEAVPFLQRAIRTEPSSWRAHALMAEAHLRQGSLEESIKQAERALELGHGKATVVQPVLAAALLRHGERERAAAILKGYLQEHPGDEEAQKQLAFLQTPPSQIASETTIDVDADTMSPTVGEGVGDVLPSNWLPPDVDERVPPVEPGATCALDDVLQKAGKQVQEFVKNVDRFTASEFLKHEAVDKWGIAGSTETRKFDYVVAVEEPKPGFLNVEEYRGGPGAVSEFPGGVATMGLPALPLIFHPYNAVNFEMTCEGLTRWNGTLAWQVHFRQRRDKPNTIRSYRLGMDGPSYPVALKGRAWILADSFQIARLETDLIAPVPQIRLVADHTAIEYGPVRFRIREVEMWLPQSAEVFYDWRGKRIHRRHSFSNYMLFGVDQKQRISQPKVETQIPPEN